MTDWAIRIINPSSRSGESLISCLSSVKQCDGKAILTFLLCACLDLCYHKSVWSFQRKKPLSDWSIRHGQRKKANESFFSLPSNTSYQQQSYQISLTGVTSVRMCHLFLHSFSKCHEKKNEKNSRIMFQASSYFSLLVTLPFLYSSTTF